jgi:hypothetical protein
MTPPTRPALSTRDRLDPVNGRLGLRLLAPLLLGFWGLYFMIVALSNLADLLRFAGVLPAAWRWTAGNLAFIASSIAPAGLPAGLSAILLAGVVVWQALASALFWRAARRGDGPALGPPFVVSVALWTTFVLLDEVLLIFETGVEAAHVRLLIAELVTLSVLLAILRPGGLGPHTTGS